MTSAAGFVEYSVFSAAQCSHIEGELCNRAGPHIPEGEREHLLGPIGEAIPGGHRGSHGTGERDP